VIGTLLARAQRLNFCALAASIPSSSISPSSADGGDPHACCCITGLAPNIGMIS